MVSSPLPSSNLSSYSRTVRGWYLDEARKGNDNTLHVTIASGFFPNSYSYTHGSNPITYHEGGLHDKWYALIQSALHIESNHPAQDRLVRLVLHARELGVLKRIKKTVVDGKEAETEEEAITSDGRMWCDLPFLVGDLKIAWDETMVSGFPTWKRENLTAFIARLAGLGVCDDKLAGCGLSIMKEALEFDRDLVPSVPASPSTLGPESDLEVEGLSTKDDDKQLTALDFMPIIKLWLQYAGSKMSHLSDISFESRTWQSQPGHLAIIAGISEAGFSKSRFIFWRKRMEELKWCDENAVWEQASQCVEMMKSISLERRET